MGKKEQKKGDVPHTDLLIVLLLSRVSAQLEAC